MTIIAQQPDTSIRVGDTVRRTDEPNGPTGVVQAISTAGLHRAQVSFADLAPIWRPMDALTLVRRADEPAVEQSEQITAAQVQTGDIITTGGMPPAEVRYTTPTSTGVLLVLADADGVDSATVSASLPVWRFGEQAAAAARDAMQQQRRRAATVAALRRVAGLLERDEMPMPEYLDGLTIHGRYTPDGLDTMARLLGSEVKRLRPDNPHVYLSHDLDGVSVYLTATLPVDEPTGGQS